MKETLRIALNVSLGINVMFPLMILWIITGGIIGVFATIISGGNFLMMPLSLGASFIFSTGFFFTTGLIDLCIPLRLKCIRS
ncbi:MAG: hypothetical protein PF549_04420 [Patescibacteria group bacterium]|nr:hypothetical protein [Patescibacteria group bacterium]